ncbi:MAG: PKD domain-containing protein [Gemmatimonadetes bacterium]|nr:PKD domain-containing protein [Gemmatimonadota bacterium]
MNLKQWTRFSAVAVTSAALLMAACVDESLTGPQVAEPSAPPLSSHAPGGPGDHIFLESGGQVVVEAEHFSSRTALLPENWFIVPTEAEGFPSLFSNYRGDGYVQGLPDILLGSSGPGGGVGNPPYVDYLVRLATRGSYRLYVRWDSHDRNSDSFYASIVEVSDDVGGSVPDWYRYAGHSGDLNFATQPWHGDAGFERTDAAGNETAAVWIIEEPGDYTIRFFEREDGVAIDAFILQLSDLAAPTGNGPPESETAVPTEPLEVAADTDPVVADEGQTANNTGTVSDGDGVTLSTSVGSVANNGDGTWSWSFGTTDGTAESQIVTIDADDGNGGAAQTSFTLTVNNVAPTVTSVTVPGAPVAIGDQPVSASATFTDPAGTADETYTCTVDYGDGSGPQGGTVGGTTCTGPNQTYAEAGVYSVTVAVTDKDGGTGSLTAETFFVIYDPTGGFVTGGGWINSLAGAYKLDPSLTGKVHFGFVSKYKRDATVPTGNTEFRFRAGDLNFRSSSYEFLGITMDGTNAMFKGLGTIIGGLAPAGSEFQFMIWARDDGRDTFRIKIWYEDGGEMLIYDNGFDQAIGGGSIVTHTK